MISIVVPAHNESSVIARTLRPWISGPGFDELSVTVVCNGCSDDTAAVARQFGPTVRVIESEVASKTHALNLGDQLSCSFPRFYIDADIVISVAAIRALACRLEPGDVLAVAPTAHIDLTDCSWPVRQYFTVRSRLPSAREGIGGSGVYALSEAGRARFSQFPDVIADDTFVRLQFKPEERETMATVTATVHPPRTLRQLIVVRTRAHAGTFEVGERFPELRVNKGQANGHALLSLFLDPRLWPGLWIYCCVNSLARFKASRRARNRPFVWHRDDTSRALLSTPAPK